MLKAEASPVTLCPAGPAFFSPPFATAAERTRPARQPGEEQRSPSSGWRPQAAGSQRGQGGGGPSGLVALVKRHTVSAHMFLESRGCLFLSHGASPKPHGWHEVPGNVCWMDAIVMGQLGCLAGGQHRPCSCDEVHPAPAAGGAVPSFPPGPRVSSLPAQALPDPTLIAPRETGLFPSYRASGR